MNFSGQPQCPQKRTAPNIYLLVFKLEKCNKKIRLPFEAVVNELLWISGRIEFFGEFFGETFGGVGGRKAAGLLNSSSSSSPESFPASVGSLRIVKIRSDLSPIVSSAVSI